MAHLLIQRFMCPRWSEEKDQENARKKVQMSSICWRVSIDADSQQCNMSGDADDGYFAVRKKAWTVTFCNLVETKKNKWETHDQSYCRKQDS